VDFETFREIGDEGDKTRNSRRTRDEVMVRLTTDLFVVAAARRASVKAERWRNIRFLFVAQLVEGWLNFVTM
jgi:hypothetical protein